MSEGAERANLDGARPYRVNVPGGERTLFGFRSIAESLSYEGMSPVVDYYVERVQDGRLTTYVWAANRHREVRLQIGSRLVRQWQITGDGTKIELDPLVIDVAPEIRDDRTMVPLRAALEALGAQITSFDPFIRVSYSDAPTSYDYRQAETIAPGAQAAYHSGLISLAELYFLADYQQYRTAQLGSGNPQWARGNPIAYIRFATLHDMVAAKHQLTQKDYEWIAASVAPFIGRKLTWREIQEIGRLGERSIDIVATYYHWSESGYDPVTGRWIDFTQYNEMKRHSGNSNGPDRMYLVTDYRQRIVLYIPAESKATLRPFISPSRFRDNAPFWEQANRLSQWSDPAVSKPFQTLMDNYWDYMAKIERGELTWEQVKSLIDPVRVATSPNGGFTEAVMEQAEAEGMSYAGFTFEEELIGGNLPAIAVPPEEE
jgi:hypothetical protein